MDKKLLEHVLEGNIPPEAAKQLEFERLNPMQQQQRTEESMMTNPIAQLSSFINTLFNPTAHDAIDSIIGENNNSVAQQQLDYESDVPRMDAILKKRAAGFGPSFGNKDVDSLIELLLRSQGEFGAAQPVSPRMMPR
tara:strand:- start:368 stop:778 length:411 start_codon:yes stop_codon:yes gene_type:complete